MEKEGYFQEVLEVAANNIHHLEVVVRKHSVFLVGVVKIQQNVQEACGLFDLLGLSVVVHFAVLELRTHYPFQGEEVRVHCVEKMMEGHLDQLEEGEGGHYALLVLVVGVHFLLNLGFGVKVLYVLRVPLKVVVGVLCLLQKVWVVKHVMKRT